MKKTTLLMVLGAIFLIALTAFGSAQSIRYTEDIKGENRGFVLSTGSGSGHGVAQRNDCGYYDWRVNSRCGSTSNERVSEVLALEAFRTFQTDSLQQNILEREKERNNFVLRNNRVIRGSHGYGRFSGALFYGNHYNYGYHAKPYFTFRI